MPHAGPMAQNFYAAFGLGADDTHIATVDADGVALAAIQGLSRQAQTQSAALTARVSELEARLGGSTPAQPAGTRPLPL